MRHHGDDPRALQPGERPLNPERLALVGTTLDERAQEPQLVRFEWLTLMTAGAVRRTGLRLLPTGRRTLHHSIEFDDLADGMARLQSCEHRTVVNPYHLQ